MPGSVVGREAEQAAVDSMLAGAQEGLRLLVLEGEPGIGKTTVWREGIVRAGALGYRVLSCRAAQAESRLSFAGLGDLLGPVESETLEALPGPQRRGLGIALLRTEAEGPAPEPRTIGTAVVSLLTTLSVGSPVLLALDDLQWLDRPTARALEFALRRLENRPVAVLATVRLGGTDSRVALISAETVGQVRRSRLGPLSLGALYEVVKEQLGQALTRPLLGRIGEASGGNPFYALEIARALKVQGPGASGEALPIPQDMRELVARRLRRLPQGTRDELLKASALAQPTVALADFSELEPAVEADIVRINEDGGVEFSHPLFAGAVYRRASRERRRALHRELAERVTDVEERAGHLALATDGPDERVAALIEQGADLAHRRGAPEVAAELQEQALRCTPAGAEAVRWGRCLRAAGHHFKAGDQRRGRALAEEIIAASASPPVRARALQLLAEERGMTEGPAAAVPLFEEALGCISDDPALAAQLKTALGLLAASQMDGAGAARHLDLAVELAEEAGDRAVLAEALSTRTLARLGFGLGADEASLERALALEDPEHEVAFQLSPSVHAAQFYEFTARLDRARELLVGLREQILARGEEGALPYVLAHLAATTWLSGELETGEREAGEALRVAALTGQEISYTLALAARAATRAVRGDDRGSRADAEEALSISERIGWPPGIAQARWAQALLGLSQGDPRAAARALDPVVTSIEQLGVYEWPNAMFVPDAIEAFVATGELERAARLTDALADWGKTHDRPWALALSARCRALLEAEAGALESAQDHAERAIVAHERLPMPFELARTLLLRGQLQRRRGERRAARESLERSLALFEELGAPLWAEKARTEARRIGVRRAPVELTENERLVAELAAEGMTSREIAAQMFVSRRTVEATLARAYRKLGIRTRAELGATMATRGSTTPP